MTVKVDPEFVEDLKEYGVSDWNDCYHCGNCTAICPLTETGFLFPRRAIRYMQMGLKKNLSQSVEPWLCYYCGECSDTCPRNANPGEIMMSLRRYLTSLYDWTGLSRMFYKSITSEIVALALVFFLVIGMFIFHHGPMVTDGVQLNTFAPWHAVELGDLIMAALVSFFLLSNIFNMYLKIIIFDKKLKVPIYLYVKEFWLLIYHFVSQIRLFKCEDKRSYWLSHWLLMTGYATMFTMVVVFLKWFQTDNIYPITHPQRWLGYYATFGLLYGTIVFMLGRLKKDKQNNKYSHDSDWVFLTMLLLVTLTGIMVHIFRYMTLPHATYYTYAIHLALAVAMIMVEVPFSKWSHLAYRPFAMYFANLKKSALELQAKKSAILN